MEQVIEKKGLMTTIWPVILLFVLAFTMVAIVFGVDSMLAGVHDTFHDFRHAIGMVCH